MLERVDAAILAAHQWAIDKTQIEPETAKVWLLRAAALFTLAIAARNVSDGIGGWVEMLRLILMPVWVVLLYVFAYMPSSYHTDGFAMIYRMLYVTVAVTTPLLSIDGVLAEGQSLAALAVLYLCLCEKPKPPRRETRLEAAT